MNKDVNQLKNYLNSLINESQSKGDQYGDLVDFWVYIFGDSEFYNTGYYSEFSKGGAYDFESHPKMAQQGEQGKSNMGFKTNFHANSKKLFSYKYLEKIMSHKEVDIGNPEIRENILIDNLEPLRYLPNLTHISICNNMVKSLEPIWNHKHLKVVWIENTKIPIAERQKFIKEHPECKLHSQVFL